MTGYRRFGIAAGGPSDPGAAVGGRGHRLARAGPARRRRCRTGRQVPGRGAPTGSGSCAATARWPKDRCGRPSTRPRTTSWPTSSRSSMSTGSARRGPTELSWDLDAYRRRAEAFGAQVFAIDGHDVAAIDAPSRRRATSAGTGRPSSWPARARAAVSPRSRTGRAGTASRFPPDMAERAIIELGGERHLVVRGRARGRGHAAPARPDGAEVKPPVYDRGDKVATRKAYGDTLAALGARRDVVALDGEVSNSTYADEFAQAHPDRYFEMFIAEQQLVAAAVGCQRTRLPAVRVDLRGLLHPGLRLHPDGGDLRGPASAWSARTPASRSAPTARRRWRSRTWP